MRRMTRRRRRRRRRRTRRRRRRRRRRTRRRRWWCWRRSSCFRHLSFQMEMSTRHAFLYGVVCVWIWHVIGQLCFDPSTRARSWPRLQTARASCVGVGIRMYVCSACGRQAGGGRGRVRFSRSLNGHRPPRLSSAGSASTTRMRLLNGGWGIFSRWLRPLTQAVWKRPG